MQQIIDVRGRPPGKMIRKGMFRDEHFDEDNNFLFSELGEVTKKACARLARRGLSPVQMKTTVIKNPAPTKDLLTMLMPDARHVEDKRKMQQLKVATLRLAVVGLT